MTKTAPTSHTETFSLNRDGIADLGLPVALDERLRDALDGDHRHEIQDEISTAITARIQRHGVNTETGEWYGDWSAEEIVRDALNRPA